MADIARKYADRLEELKRRVEEGNEYFRDNVNRYKRFMRFVFKSNLDQDETGVLIENSMPTLEFNIVEQHISRLRGEFAKQQPSLSVRAVDGIPLQYLTPVFTETIKVIEAHMRAIFFDAANDMLEYDTFSDLLAGGFSVLRVYTDYVNEMSFEQNIHVSRVFDPTLCVFDPMARTSHKGDGKFCAELYPMTKEEFALRFGEDKAERVKCSRNNSGISWSFKNEKQEVILVCDYYEKKQKREKIIKLSNGHTVAEKEYKKFLEKWEESGIIEQPPIPVGQPRWTTKETICRYRFCQNEMLDYVETNYKYLPLVFVDGNSVTIFEGDTSSQMTRPYVYHAEGIQRLKNYAGQSLANELESLIQHKFLVAMESLPDEKNYLEAYNNVQKASTLVYKHFLDELSPQVTLPPPVPIVRPPIPPQISDTFRMSDEMTTAILGAFQPTDLGRGDLSGLSVARQALMSNTASVPYIVGYIKGLNRVAEIVLDLIPKYYRTPRSLPILLPSGQREYMEINKPGSLYMNYDASTLQVKVDVGVNFAMQKELALQTIIALMQASPKFAEFMNEKGLQILLDNIDIRNIEELKSKAAQFEEEQAQMKQQQAQMQQQEMQQQQQAQQVLMAQAQRELNSPTPEELGMYAVQEKAKVDAANVAIKQQDSNAKFLEIMAKVQGSVEDRQIKMEEVAAENARTAVEAIQRQSEKLGDLL